MKKNNFLFLKGMLLGMEQMGAEFYKIDDEFLYLLINKGSKMHNIDVQKKAKYALQASFGIGLKVKINNSLQEQQKQAKEQ